MNDRKRLAMALAATIAGCAGADAPGPLPPSAPVALTASAAPRAIERTFAATEPDVAFRDPDRKKKLASAFPVIDGIVDEEVKRQGLASVAVGIVIDGELAHVASAGFADLQKKNKPDADTIYRIGSITKSFTALSLLSLRDEGVIGLDDPVTKWIPEAAGLVYLTKDAPPITLRQMLTHSAGLPRETRFPLGGGVTEEDVLKSLAGLPLDSAPGTRYLYANLGYVLLGLTVARAAHTPFPEVLKRRLLAPLGMTSSSLKLEDEPADRVAMPYRRSRRGEALEPAPHWNIGAAAGAGALFSSLRDMAKYVAFQLDAYPPRSAPERGPVRRSTRREAHSSGIPAGMQVRVAEGPEKGESLVDVEATSYAFGWGAGETCAFDDLVNHNGGMPGYLSDVTFFRERGVGFILFVNTLPADIRLIHERIVRALSRSGGMIKRTPALSPAFHATMTKFLSLYQSWDDGLYRAVTSGERDAVEREELAGYKALHGACKGYSPIEAMGEHEVRLAMECERGPFEMLIQLSADDARIVGFVGTSRGLAVTPELQKVASDIAGLVKRWDEGAYKKRLARAKPPREETQKTFERLRATYGACAVRSTIIEGFDRRLVLDCERGPAVALTLDLDPKDPNAALRWAFVPERSDRCPVR
jgi:CubicO group peptidase (beta-lactamase class C family)